MHDRRSQFKITEIDNLLFELDDYNTCVSLSNIMKADGLCAIRRKPERMMEREMRS